MALLISLENLSWKIYWWNFLWRCLILYVVRAFMGLCHIHRWGSWLLSLDLDDGYSQVLVQKYHSIWIEPESRDRHFCKYHFRAVSRRLSLQISVFNLCHPSLQNSFNLKTIQEYQDTRSSMFRISAKTPSCERSVCIRNDICSTA